MGEYGYAYKSVSSYSTTSVRNETRKPALIQQPFVPSLPKTNDHGYSEGHVTRKTIIPVTSSRPYHDSSTPPTSPVGGSPRKVHEFPSPTNPQRFGPVANSTGWRQTPQPTSPPYSSAEGRKPIGSTTFNNHDGYDGHGSNGYGIGTHGDYGGHKEGRKPIESTIRNDNYDAHNGYGGDYGSNKGPHKPISNTMMNNNYDVHNGYGGDYGKGHKPIASTNHGGYYNNGYGGDKEGRKPVIGSSTKIDSYQYDGPNGYGGYGDHDDHYNKKEGYKPISNPNYNNGYGINSSNKEQHRPFGYGSSTPKDKYDSDYVNYNKREGHGHGHGHMQKPIGPKISSAWTTAPRKGTQLSEPTNDIEKALELLRMEAAKREHMHSNTDYEYQYDKKTPTTHLPNWAAPPGPVSNGSRFAGGSPQHGSPRVANKFGNSQPRMSPTGDTIFDGRDGDDDYHRDEYGHVPVINSREAEKKFKGTRVW